MSAAAAALARLAVTLLAGSLWVVGYVVAPTLFSMLERGLAGDVAGQLFTWVAWLSIASATLALALDYVILRSAKPWVAVCLWSILALAMVGHFAIRPQIAELKAAFAALSIDAEAYRAAFGRWHALSGAAYLAQSILAGAVVIGWRR